MKQKRIKVMVVGYCLGEGGAERFTSTLLCHLDRQRFAPRLCLIRDRLGYPLPDDVPLAILGKSRPWHLARTVRRLRAELELQRPQVVLSTISFASLVTGLALKGLAPRPLWIARVGANPEREHDGRLKPVHQLLLKRVYGRVDRFACNSLGLAAALARFHPPVAGRISTLGNPTDFAMIDRLASESAAQIAHSSEPSVLYVGRLSREKRPDLLLEAFSLLRGRMPARLWICGDGPLRESLAGRIARLGLGDSVHLLGFLDNPYPLMTSASVLALPSDWEGLPNVLIEAGGLGLPAVSTRCPYGPEEIVEDGRSGLLTPPGDAPALAAALESLLQDRKRRLAMGRAAKELVRRRFGLHELLPCWEELLEGEALQGQAHKRSVAGGGPVPGWGDFDERRLH